MFSIYVIPISYSICVGVSNCRASEQLIASWSCQLTAPLAANRSYKTITRRDLARFAALADADRIDFFKRKPDTGRLYAGRLIAVALCQGAALHYVDGTNGIKDFDVWSFYDQHPQRPFPYRRRAKVDFGDPKFGKTTDSPQYIGRRVDLIGRSMRDADARYDPAAHFV